MKNLLLHICSVVLCVAVSACSAGSDTLVNPGDVSTQLTVLAGAANKGSLFQSTDDGETWTESVIDGYQRGIEHFSTNGSDLYCSDVFGVYRCSKGDTTWQQTDTLLGGPSSLLSISSTVFVGIINKIKWSTDRGDSWHDANINANSVVSFASKGRTLYCASVDYVYVSSDNGRDWSISRSLNEFGLHSLAADDSFLYVGNIYGYIARTRNDGISWDSLPLPVTHGTINSITASSGSVYVAHSAKGVYRSMDRGLTWQQLSSDLLGETKGIAVRGTTIFASGIANSNGPGGITKSTDGGKTWKQVLTTDCLPILIK